MKPSTTVRVMQVTAFLLAGALRTQVLIQARRLEPADFIVAGVPDSYPDVNIADDTIQVRRILGRPRALRRHEVQPGDTMTTWQYDGLEVEFGSGARQGITLTSSRVPTHRGLRVGDPESRITALYGPSAERTDSTWVYTDPHEELHAIIVTSRAGRVVRIFIGMIWD